MAYAKGSQVKSKLRHIGDALSLHGKLEIVKNAKNVINFISQPLLTPKISVMLTIPFKRALFYNMLDGLARARSRPTRPDSPGLARLDSPGPGETDDSMIVEISRDHPARAGIHRRQPGSCPQDALAASDGVWGSAPFLSHCPLSFHIYHPLSLLFSTY